MLWRCLPGPHLGVIKSESLGVVPGVTAGYSQPQAEVSHRILKPGWGAPAPLGEGWRVLEAQRLDMAASWVLCEWVMGGKQRSLGGIRWEWVSDRQWEVAGAFERPGMRVWGQGAGDDERRCWRETQRRKDRAGLGAM